MSRIAFLFVVLALAAAAIAGLPSLLDNLADGDRTRLPEAPQQFSHRPTFDANLPRKPALHVGFTDLAGNEFHLGQFQGKVLLVNFWATWCAPCRRELPSLLRLREILADDGFRLLMISTDRQGAEIVVPFLEANGLDDSHTYLDTEHEAYGAFGTEAVPTTILFDRIGREIGRHSGSMIWDNPETVSNIRQILRR